MRLASNEYNFMASFLAHAKDNKDLEEIASRFTPEALLAIQAAIRKINEAITKEQSKGHGHGRDA